MTVKVDHCIECGICTRNCVFLDKYSLNLKEFIDRPDLAYHCYLCGECRRVCPVDIDGRQIGLDLRRELVEQDHNLYKNGFAMMLLEKKNYVFKNYRKAKSKIAFFPGCNFPAYFPETTKLLSNILQEDFGISTVFDCCGKPIFDFQMMDQSATITSSIKERLKAQGIEELVTACPNCYYHFNNNTDVKVTMIYEHEDIMERIIDRRAAEEITGRLFLPCPDKNERIIYKMINKYVDLDSLEEISEIQCCGAGGAAFLKEQDLTKNIQDEFKKYEEEILLYCATCAGMITKSNENVSHLLCKLLKTDEKVSTGLSSVLNRTLFAIKG